MSLARHDYGVFGLTVSSDVELPKLSPPAKNGRRVAVRVSAPVDRTSEGAGPPAFPGGMERMWRSVDGWLLRYVDPRNEENWTMRITAAGDAIDVERSAGIALEDLLEIVQFAGLAGALQLQGVLVLHGCAVDVEGRAILVLGGAGAGKSTTAAALVRRGLPLLTDDVAAVESMGGAIAVHPGPPRLRIAPHAASALGWDPGLLPRVFATELLGDKRYVDLSVTDGTFCAEPREIGAIFALATRIKAPQAKIEALSPERAFKLLRVCCYRDFLLGPAEHALRFPMLARVAREVPVHLVRAPDDHSALPGVVEALLAEVGGGAPVTMPNERGERKLI